MESVFLWVCNRSLTATWLILAVMLLRLCLKKAPRWILCALWIPVGLRLACPLSLESAVSLLPSGQPLPQGVLYEATPTIQSGIPTVDGLINPALAGSLSPDLGDSLSPSQVLSFIAARLWVVGIVAMLLYTLVAIWRLHRRVCTAARQPDDTWLCDRIDSPFILGIFRPRIYLPSTLLPEHTAHVLAHEQAHLRRRDHWWKPLGFAVLAVHWFNPLVWVAYALLCRDIEMACDQRVVRDADVNSRKTYSAALLACSTPPHLAVGCPLAFGEVGVKARIKAVLHYKKPAFWVIIVAILAGIAVTVGLLTDPVAVKTPSCPSVTVSHTHGEMNVSIHIATWGEDSFQIAWTNGNGFDVMTGEIYRLYKKNDKGAFQQVNKDFVFHLVGHNIPANEENLWLEYDQQRFVFEEGETYRLEFPFHIAEKHLNIDENEDENATEEFTNYIDFQIATDHSDLYTEDDINEAKRIVETYFNRHFDDCTLLQLWYDENRTATQAEEWAAQYKTDEAIVLLSNFKTGKHTDGSLNPNNRYDNWSWVLVRDEGGKWDLKTWGYG